MEVVDTNSPVVFVGLGNPGDRYAHTRHNIGFALLDEICRRYGLEGSRKGDVFLSKGRVLGREIRAIKPLAYMNCSGPALAKALGNLRKPYELIVLHDDLDLALGRAKIKYGGSSGGHKGLESIDATIGRDYWRLRVGIGRPEQQDLVERYVLAKFSPSEWQRLQGLFAAAAEIIDYLPFTEPRIARFLDALRRSQEESQIAA